MTTEEINNLQGVRRCRVTNSTAQSTTSAVNAYVSFNTEDYDTDNIHDNSTNNSRLTCKTPGLYIITGNLEFVANTTGIRSLGVSLNRTTTLSNVQVSATSAYGTQLNVSAQYYLNIGDYVELSVYQDSGGSLNVQGQRFAMVRIG